MVVSRGRKEEGQGKGGGQRKRWEEEEGLGSEKLIAVGWEAASDEEESD